MEGTDIKCYRGNTLPIVVTITKLSDGEPYNLTGFTARFTVKKSFKEQDSAARIGPITGTITAPTSGVVEFALSRTDTDFVAGNYYYDITITSADENTTLFTGNFYLVDNVTRISTV